MSRSRSHTTPGCGYISLYLYRHTQPPAAFPTQCFSSVCRGGGAQNQGAPGVTAQLQPTGGEGGPWGGGSRREAAYSSTESPPSPTHAVLRAPRGTERGGPQRRSGRSQSKPCQSLCSESYSNSAPTQRTPSSSIGVPWCRSMTRACTTTLRQEPSPVSLARSISSLSTPSL